MSPLFHRDGDGSGGPEPGPGHLPSLYELGPRLDEVVNNVAALPPEQFAAQLMTRYFTVGWPVASQITSMVAADTICWDLAADGHRPLQSACTASPHSGHRNGLRLALDRMKA